MKDKKDIMINIENFIDIIPVLILILNIIIINNIFIN